MPTDNKPAPSPSTPQTVHVAIYEHRHGTDVRVFLDRDQALGWRTALAQEWWDNEFHDDPSADVEIGEQYFERMLEHGDEFSRYTPALSKFMMGLPPIQPFGLPAATTDVHRDHGR